MFCGILIVLCGVADGCQKAAKPVVGDLVCFNQTCFTVEVVRKPDALANGLMRRSSMPENHGMLFVFPRIGLYPFWMKNTMIPLDIIWLDYSRRVVDLSVDVPPCRTPQCPTYSPRQEALYVLEINAGEAVRAGIQLGATAAFHVKLP